MGPSLRAGACAGPRRGRARAPRRSRSSRFSEPGLARGPRRATASRRSPATSSTPRRWRACPTFENVLFLAGMKFGASDRPDLTWALNVVVPAYRGAALRRLADRGVLDGQRLPPRAARRPAAATETRPAGPVGEYAQSCLGRERVFEHFSRERGTQCLLFRLFYAVDLRYGVLVDVARKVLAGEPVDLTVGHVNAIWQGDANSYALRAPGARRDAAPPLDVTGPEAVSRARRGRAFGRRFGRAPRFHGVPGPGPARRPALCRPCSASPRCPSSGSSTGWPPGSSAGGAAWTSPRTSRRPMADSEGLSALRSALLEGLVIPAHPLALTAERRLDERRQVALTRYYCDAGAGGVAVGVHTTQFADPRPRACSSPSCASPPTAVSASARR